MVVAAAFLTGYFWLRFVVQATKSHCPIVRQRRTLHPAALASRLQLSAAPLLEWCKKSPCFIFHIKNLNSTNFISIYPSSTPSQVASSSQVLTPTDKQPTSLSPTHCLAERHISGRWEEAGAPGGKSLGWGIELATLKTSSNPTLAEMETVI